MTKEVENNDAAISEEQVVEYLRTHPDFFANHEYLLRDLRVPHKSGAAISLGERQVQVFREHRDELKHQLDDLLTIAKENDEHFEKSKRLLLNLLEVKSLDEFDLVIREAFQDDENIDFSSVIVFGDQADYPVAQIHVIDRAEAEEQLGNLIDSSNAVCGQFGQKQLACLFPLNAESVKSAAVIPLRNDETFGMFSLGSKDPRHFDSAMGSLFLSYISDFICRLLPGLLTKSRGQKNSENIPSLLD